MDLPTALIGFINEGILIGKSPNTQRKYSYCLQLFINYLKNNFYSVDITSFNTEMLQAFFIDGVKEHKWTKSTYFSNYSDYRAFSNWLLKKRIIEINAFDSIPKPKMPARYPKALKEEEIIMLLRAASHLDYKYKFIRIRNKAIIATFLFTGVRKTELIDLKASDVDLNTGFIFVRHGKGDKPREIPIEPSVLRPILEEYANYRKKLGMYPNYFFNGQWSSNKVENSCGRSALDQLFRRLSAKLKMRIHAHQLRHSFATMALDRTNGDIFTISKLLGHSDPSTTAIYLNSTVKRKVEVINSLKLNLN